MAHYLDSFGNFDLDAVYDLGNQWIAAGDALHEQLQSMTGAVHGMSWSGDAGKGATSLWDEDVTRIVNDACNSAWQIGEAINYYGDQVKAAADQAKKEAIASMVADILGTLLGFLLPGIGTLLSRLISIVEKVVSAIISVLSKILGRLGALAPIGGFAMAAVGGAALQLGIDVVSHAIGNAAAGLPFQIDWKSEAINLGVAGGIGGLFGALGANDIRGGNGVSPKATAPGPKTTVETPPAIGNQPHANPGGVDPHGTGGGRVTAPPAPGSATPHSATVASPGSGSSGTGHGAPAPSDPVKSAPSNVPSTRAAAPGAGGAFDGGPNRQGAGSNSALGGGDAGRVNSGGAGPSRVNSGGAGGKPTTLNGSPAADHPTPTPSGGKPAAFGDAPATGRPAPVPGGARPSAPNNMPGGDRPAPSASGGKPGTFNNGP
ncbi:MAG: hypothetical protein JWR24_2578, partial [Actinoallomurus sp.]|nr:hypothetical protein [Actinoallomurus sp.]